VMCWPQADVRSRRAATPVPVVPTLDDYTDQMANP